MDSKPGQGVAEIFHAFDRRWRIAEAALNFYILHT